MNRAADGYINFPMYVRNDPATSLPRDAQRPTQPKKIPDMGKIIANAMIMSVVDPIAALAKLFYTSGEEPTVASKSADTSDPYPGLRNVPLQETPPMLIHTPDSEVTVPSLQGMRKDKAQPSFHERIVKGIDDLRNHAHIDYGPDEDSDVGEALEFGLGFVMSLGIGLAEGVAPVAGKIASTRSLPMLGKLAMRGTALVERDGVPIIRILFTEAMAADVEVAQWARFNIEWAQAELGTLRRAARVPEDAAFRRAAGRWADSQGYDRAGLDAMHPLDSIANPFAKANDMGTTYYYGNRTVNRSFGSQLQKGLNAAGVEIGDQFRIEFLGFPDLEVVPPRSPAIASPPNLPVRAKYRK